MTTFLLPLILIILAAAVCIWLARYEDDHLDDEMRSYLDDLKDRK